MPTTTTIESPVARVARSTTPPELTLATVEVPDGRRAPLQAYDRLETTIRVSEGVVYVVAGDDDTILRAGDTLVVEPGVPYRRWNAGDAVAAFSETFRTVAPVTSGVRGWRTAAAL